MRLVDATRQDVHVVLAPRKPGRDIFRKIGRVVPARVLTSSIHFAVLRRWAAALFRFVRLVGQAQQRAGSVQAVQSLVHHQVLWPVLRQKRTVEKQYEPGRFLRHRGGQERGGPARRPFVDQVPVRRRRLVGVQELVAGHVIDDGHEVLRQGRRQQGTRPVHVGRVENLAATAASKHGHVVGG